MDNFERVLDSVRKRTESRLSAFQTLSEHVWFLIWKCLACRSNVFSFSFECVWLLVWAHLASHLNAFGFSFKLVWLFVQTWLTSRSNVFGFSLERVSYNSWTHLGCGANPFIRGANAFGPKTRYTLCLTGTVHVYDVPASIDLIILSFWSIINANFLRLNFSAVLRTLLKFYSIDNATTVHAQSNQGCVQIIEGSYNGVFR